MGRRFESCSAQFPLQASQESQFVKSGESQFVGGESQFVGAESQFVGAESQFVKNGIAFSFSPAFRLGGTASLNVMGTILMVSICAPFQAISPNKHRVLFGICSPAMMCILIRDVSRHPRDVGVRN